LITSVFTMLSVAEARS